MEHTFKVGDLVERVQKCEFPNDGFGVKGHYYTVLEVSKHGIQVTPDSCHANPKCFKLVKRASEGAVNSNVKYPTHYNESGIEAIEAIKATLGAVGFQAYCKGNVMKYLWRYQYKAGLEDLEKAQVYLGWMVESMKESETDED